MSVDPGATEVRKRLAWDAPGSGPSTYPTSLVLVFTPHVVRTFPCLQLWGDPEGDSVVLDVSYSPAPRFLIFPGPSRRFRIVAILHMVK